MYSGCYCTMTGIQGLASSERARRVTEDVGDPGAEGSSVVGNGGQGEISHMPDVDSTGLGFFIVTR